MSIVPEFCHAYSCTFGRLDLIWLFWPPAVLLRAPALICYITSLRGGHDTGNETASSCGNLCEIFCILKWVICRVGFGQNLFPSSFEVIGRDLLLMSQHQPIIVLNFFRSGQLSQKFFVNFGFISVRPALGSNNVHIYES